MHCREWCIECGGVNYAKTPSWGELRFRPFLSLGVGVEWKKGREIKGRCSASPCGIFRITFPF